MTTSPRTFGIIPAAGLSRRMGQPKLFLDWNGRTIIDRVLDAWQASHVNHLVIVVRADNDQLLSLARGRGIDVVVPDPPPEDMKASVGAGLAHVAQQYSPGEADAWLVAPADMPRLHAAAIDRVLAAHARSSGKIVVPVCEGLRGHPVLFPWHLADDARRLEPDESVKSLLDRAPIVEVQVDDVGIARDVDTPADYEAGRRESAD